MIVTVCGDKGAPGATSLATALGLVWPHERVVLEADCAGGDLAFRLRSAEGDRLLDQHPSVLSLAADCRGSQPGADLLAHAQLSSLGVPVVPGALSPEACAPVASLWVRVAHMAAGWSGTVFADLGRLHPGHPALPLAYASTAVLLVARPDLEGLYRLRHRVGELTATLGQSSASRTRLGVVVRAVPGRVGTAAVEQVRQVLEAAGSTVPVLGVVAEDPTGVGLLWQGAPSRGLLGSDLVRSARSLAATALSVWPDLAPAAAVADPARQDESGVAPRRLRPRRLRLGARRVLVRGRT